MFMIRSSHSALEKQFIHQILLTNNLQCYNPRVVPDFRGRHEYQHRLFASVTGTAYSSDNPKALVVVLYTKEGCTLCDKVKDVLKSLSQDDYPHSLEQIDITDEEHTKWYDMYKYDIPVLHINKSYWTKHRLDETEAKNGLKEALENGDFQPRRGQPNAAEMERKQAERENSK